MPDRSLFRHAVVGALIVGLVPLVSAQEFGEVAAELRRNLDALRGYTWKAKVEFSMDGELKSTQVFQVSMDGDGKLHRELISSEGKTTKQQDAARHSLSSIRNSIDAYTGMSPDAFRAAFGENPRTVQHGRGGEPTLITASDVVSRGDTMQIWVDPGDYRLLKLHLDTALQRNPVRVEANFTQLEGGGPTYASDSTLYTHSKKKALTLVTHNYDLTRSDP